MSRERKSPVASAAEGLTGAAVGAAERKALVRYGRYELERGRAQRAVDVLQVATKLDPFDREAWLALADAHERTGSHVYADVIREIAGQMEATQ